MDEKILFSLRNCQVVTDDSCCLSNEELMNLNVITLSHEATPKEAEKLLKTALKEKEFVLFVGTAKSLSKINDIVDSAAEHLDEKDKSLNAKRRVKTFNSSSFSGGLGFFVTLFADFVYSGKTSDEIDGYSVFLANHIVHYFIEPSEKRWNNLIYVPRTGKINFAGGKFRGNRGIYNHLAADFRDHAYNPEEQIWVCANGKNDEAKILARQFKRCCPDSKIDLSHKIASNVITTFSDEVISCFFLSKEVRPDEPNTSFEHGHFAEIEEKTFLAKKNITAIARYSQAFCKNPNPTF